MYTPSIRREKTNTFFQMKTLNSAQKLEKLGSSIYVSMQRLQQLKIAIMSQKDQINEKLVMQLKQVHTEFIEKQKSLMEIQQNSDKLDRLKVKVKEFLESFTLDDLQKKIQSMHRIRASNNQKINTQSNEQGQVGYQLSGQSLNKKLLQEQYQQLKQIQRCITLVKGMVIDFSQLILGYGQKINIAADSIKSARIKMKQAHMELEETNAIERDTAKNKYLLCALIIVVLIVIFLIYRASRK